MPGFDGFLDVPARSEAARQGLTHVLDKGLSLPDIEGLFDTAGDYVDIVKLGWGTSYVTGTSRRRSRSTARSRPRSSAAGRSSRRRRAREARRVQELAGRQPAGARRGLGRDGRPPRERKLELIADLARDFVVLSEVGSKDAEVVFPPYQWVEWIREDLDAGAWKVITEGRETGTAGIYRPSGDMRTGLIDEIVHEIDVGRRLRGSRHGGPGLVRPAVRPRGQPRQRPAGGSSRSRRSASGSAPTR